MKASRKQNGSVIIPILIVVILVGITVGVLSQTKSKDTGTRLANTLENKTNPYLGVPCTSSPKVQFTNDFTEVDKIKSVEPTIITPGNPRHRAWLNIAS